MGRLLLVLFVLAVLVNIPVNRYGTSLGPALRAHSRFLRVRVKHGRVVNMLPLACERRFNGECLHIDIGLH